MTALDLPDLRQQLAEALYQWTLHQAAPGGSRPPHLDPVTERRLRENSAARADVCAAKVQPELDRLHAVADRWAHQARRYHDQWHAAERDNARLRKQLAGLRDAAARLAELERQI